jgi:hypothetical protein
MRRSYHRSMLDIAQTNFAPNLRAQVSALLIYRVVAMSYLALKSRNTAAGAKSEALMALKVALKYFRRPQST